MNKNRKIMILIGTLLLVLALYSTNAFATVAYPTEYPSTKYAYIFYQTNINTTLNASITRDDTTLVLNDASGFSTPGMLYFPSDGEIMHINSISGNTVTVNRDLKYTAGSGRFAHTAGETVVFAHLQYTTADSVQYFQDNAQDGDFVLFGTSYSYHFLESINLSFTTPANYTSADFEAFELNNLGTTSGDSEYYDHQIPLEFYDGTNGFKQNGTITFLTHESGLPTYYNLPLNFYAYVYDESGNHALAFYVGIKLRNPSGWTQGATGTRTYYEKILRPDGESDLSWSSLYYSDKTTRLSLANDDVLHRQMVLYDEKKMPLDISVSNYSASGDITITGLQNDQNLYAYFPFVKGTGFTFWDLRNYREFLASSNLNLAYGYGYENEVNWVNGQFSGKKALHVQDIYTGVTSYFDTRKAYGKLGNKFSVEAIVRVNNSDGSIFTIGTGDYYNKVEAYPFRFIYNSARGLRAEVSTDTANYYAADSSFTTGDWHYIVATFDGDDLRLYVDGNLMNTTAVNGTLLTNSKIYFIFGGRYSSTSYFNGDFSELAIWNNRVLTPTEISNRNTKQTNEYLQQISENVSVSRNGTYTTSTDFSFITNLSHTGTYNYNLAQPRLNIIGKDGQKYILYTDFGLKDSTFTDTSNSEVQIGTPWTYNYRAFNLNKIGTGSFTLGKDVSGAGFSGGTLILYNTYAQGTYRNYLRSSYFYNTNFYIAAGSLQTNPPVAFLDCTFNSLNIGSGVGFVEGSYATISKDDDVWHGNTYNNIGAYLYQYRSYYDPTTLKVVRDEDTTLRTADETYTLNGLYYVGGFHKGITVQNYKSGGYCGYFYHYKWKEVLVNYKCLNGTFYVYPRTGAYAIYGSPTIGYTLKLKVVDSDGNPIQGAKIYITDKDGYSAIFRPVGHPSQKNIYGSNYGGAATSLAVDDGTKYSVGDIIDIYGERAEVTNISGNTLTITRAVQNTGNAYATAFSGDTDYSHSWIEKQYPYLETNASGEIPELIIYTRYYKNNTAYIDKNPFHILINKTNYCTYNYSFNLTKSIDYELALSNKSGLTVINNTAPITIDIYTQNNTNFTSKPVISFLPADMNENTTNCSIYINGTSMSTNTFQNSTISNFTLSSLQDNTSYSYQIECKDTSQSKNSSEYIFSLDSHAPNITFLNTSTPPGKQNQDWIFINISGIDNINVENASILLEANGENKTFPYKKDISIHNSIWWINYTNLRRTDYIVTVYVNDSYGNRNSATRNIDLSTAISSSPSSSSSSSSSNNNTENSKTNTTNNIGKTKKTITLSSLYATTTAMIISQYALFSSNMNKSGIFYALEQANAFLIIALFLLFIAVIYYHKNQEEEKEYDYG